MQWCCISRTNFCVAALFFRRKMNKARGELVDMSSSGTGPVSPVLFRTSRTTTIESAALFQEAARWGPPREQLASAEARRLALLFGRKNSELNLLPNTPTHQNKNDDSDPDSVSLASTSPEVFCFCVSLFFYSLLRGLFCRIPKNIWWAWVESCMASTGFCNCL